VLESHFLKSRQLGPSLLASAGGGAAESGVTVGDAAAYVHALVVASAVVITASQAVAEFSAEPVTAAHKAASATTVGVALSTQVPAAA